MSAHIETIERSLKESQIDQSASQRGVPQSAGNGRLSIGQGFKPMPYFDCEDVRDP